MRLRTALVTAALGGTLVLIGMAAPAQAAPAAHSTKAEAAPARGEYNGW